MALSFDGADPYRSAANRRGGAGGMSGMQGGPGGALPFMSFDLGAASSAPPPRVGSVGGYGGGGFGAFEDEAPLLEGAMAFYLAKDFPKPVIQSVFNFF